MWWSIPRLVHATGIIALTVSLVVADEPPQQIELIENSIGMRLVRLPEGEFSMGSQGEEVPVHRVRITKPFLLGQTEVTQGQWAKVMGDKKPWLGAAYVVESPDIPATWLTWNDAVAFCDALTALEHRSGRLPADRSYRLPTEAEWEYACRAGTNARFSFGNEDRRLGDHAWFIENTAFRAESHPHAVGRKRPNAWKLHDMHGNVAEWCSDWYDRDYYATSPAEDPSGPSDARSFRVIRGGNWCGYAVDCRSAFRLYVSPANGNCFVGMRVACEAE